jgi:hypothetical protein
MNTRAETEKSFWLKFLIIGLATLGYGLWGAKDALLDGPRRIEQAKIWEPLLNNKELEEKDRMAQWREAAEQNNWNSDRPAANITTKDAKEFVTWNYGVLVVCSIIALPCLIWCLMARGTWIESTDNGLRNSKGQELTLAQITKIDKAKWDKKGIAVVHFKTDAGVQEKFIIDDLKYQRQPTDTIMAWVEENVDDDLIVNGRTEVQIAADKAKAKADREQQLNETNS